MLVSFGLTEGKSAFIPFLSILIFGSSGIGPMPKLNLSFIYYTVDCARLLKETSPNFMQAIGDLPSLGIF